MRSNCSVRNGAAPRAFIWLAIHRRNVDRDVHTVLAAANKNALNWADIAVIAAPGQRDVRVGGDQIVGGVDVQPIAVGTVDRQPGMRGIGPAEPLATWRRSGQQIATDIACSQPGRKNAGSRSGAANSGTPRRKRST